MTDALLAPISNEFNTIDLGDARRNRRLQSVVEALWANPDASFPVAFGSSAATEGFYRLVEGGHVQWEPLMDGHVDATLKRAAHAKAILALHDSTLPQFGGDAVRAGAFRTAKSKSGFIAHTCLAVSADGAREPYGLLGMIPVVRLTDEKEAAASPGTVYANESHRWIDLVTKVHDRVGPQKHIIHVMDSEGDCFDLLSHIVLLGDDVVVRLCHDRKLDETDVNGVALRLSNIVEGATVRLQRSVKLSARPAPTGLKEAASKRHAGRDERTATMELRTVTATLLRPKEAASLDPFLTVHIVHVVEVDPPAGAEPVTWMLATTLPIETTADVERIVDIYRSRWLIEEWFKALKSGCAYEARQLESLSALLIAFALFAPIATRLLAIRWNGRNNPDRPATDLLTSTEIMLLRKVTKKRGKPLPPTFTVAEAMVAIATLGGFLPQNKTPGWQSLGRGFQELQRMVEVFDMLSMDLLEM